jgi:hypothetical protein
VVLLTAAVGCLGGAVGSSFTIAGPVLSAASPGRHTPPDYAASLHQSTRRCSRRPNLQSGPDGLFLPAVEASPETALLDQLFVSAGRSGLDTRLGNGWRSHWRVASEPRAPSSVS